MNLRLKFGLLLLVVALVSIPMVSGTVITEVRLFGEFDMNGNPGANQFVFTQEDEMVAIWFNLTDATQGDSIIIEFMTPSGELYVPFNWTPPFVIQDGTYWEMWEDLEMMGDWRSKDPDVAMTDIPGTWSAIITVDGQWYATLPFEVVPDGSSSTSTGSTGTSTGSTDTPPDDDTKIRGYYVHVTDVTPVGEVTIGQNATIEVTVEYNFMQVPLVVSILDDQFEPRGTASDEIGDYGESLYSISMETKTGDEGKMFYAIAHYFIDGNWTYMDPNGYMAFTLEGGAVDPGSPDGVEIPGGFDLSDIDVDQITSTLNETFQRGLDLLKDVEIPEELGDIEETIKEKTGIPGFPYEAIIVGTSLLGLALRKRD